MVLFFDKSVLIYWISIVWVDLVRASKKVESGLVPSVLSDRIVRLMPVPSVEGIID